MDEEEDKPNKWKDWRLCCTDMRDFISNKLFKSPTFQGAAFIVVFILTIWGAIMIYLGIDFCMQCRAGIQDYICSFRSDPCMPIAMPSFTGCIGLLCILGTICFRSPRSLGVLLIMLGLTELGLALYIRLGKQQNITDEILKDIKDTYVGVHTSPVPHGGFNIESDCWQKIAKDHPLCDFLLDNITSVDTNLTEKMKSGDITKSLYDAIKYSDYNDADPLVTDEDIEVCARSLQASIDRAYDKNKGLASTILLIAMATHIISAIFLLVIFKKIQEITHEKEVNGEDDIHEDAEVNNPTIVHTPPNNTDDNMNDDIMDLDVLAQMRAKRFENRRKSAVSMLTFDIVPIADDYI
ncbi:unnamed protein product [Owenia fusiformis]|uniref:Tetraspanin n=1 Tax=Owenia fusiformis TaxID=6347 RepID=A0A8S4NLU6_OWEFU|nr:unnamed protein product [Owenia fusiformis]